MCWHAGVLTIMATYLLCLFDALLLLQSRTHTAAVVLFVLFEPACSSIRADAQRPRAFGLNEIIVAFVSHSTLCLAAQSRLDRDDEEAEFVATGSSASDHAGHFPAVLTQRSAPQSDASSTSVSYHKGFVHRNQTRRRLKGWLGPWNSPFVTSASGLKVRSFSPAVNAGPSVSVTPRLKGVSAAVCLFGAFRSAVKQIRQDARRPGSASPHS